MNRILTSCAVVVLALAFVTTVRAESPINSDPATASYISGLPQSIPANSTAWYKFDYRGDKSPVTVLMPNGTDTLVAFNVYTPEQAQSWWDRETKPIGRGTAYPVDCTTGEEVVYSDCKSPDLKWVGQFNFPGTFYVQVVNFNTGTANFKLTIQGTGVRVSPVPPPAPTVVPQQPVPLLPTTGGVWLDAPRPLPWKLLQDW